MIHQRPLRVRRLEDIRCLAEVLSALVYQHPHLPLGEIQQLALTDDTLSISLHGADCLENLGLWEAALGNCARSEQDYPARGNGRPLHTESRIGVFGNTAIKVTAFQELHEPDHESPNTVTLLHPSRQNAHRAQGGHRLALAITVAATVATAAALLQRVRHRLSHGERLPWLRAPGK